MRDLLVTVHTPALGSGRALRTYTIARALAADGAGLDLLYAQFGPPSPDRAFREIPGVELHEIRPGRGRQRLRTYAAMRIGGAPPSMARGMSPELIAGATRLAAGRGRGRIVADGPIAAGALRRLARSQPVIYIAHNLESGFRHEIGDQSKWARRQLRAYERRLLAEASESWMVSEADAAGAAALCPSARIRYVPNVVDVSSMTPVTASAEARRVFMVADFTYFPNHAGLRFLLDDVMPRVWSEVPDARVSVAGRGLADRPEDPRVEALGFVENLQEAYAEATCAVVPLLQGGGTPLKFIEALAYGVPVVATPRAAAGLVARDGEHYRRASTATQFAASIVALMREGDGGMGLRGRALAEQRYSVEALAQLLAA